jgi:hypothetical protein
MTRNQIPVLDTGHRAHTPSTIQPARPESAAHLEPRVRAHLANQAHLLRLQENWRQEHLRQRQARRHLRESSDRQARFRPGVQGLLDRLSGRHRRTVRQNAHEADLALQRDRAEWQKLTAFHLARRRRFEQAAEQLEHHARTVARSSVRREVFWRRDFTRAASRGYQP